MRVSVLSADPLSTPPNSFQAYMVYNFVELLIAYFTPYATEQVRIKNLEALCKKMDKVKAKPPCCCMGTLHPGTYVPSPLPRPRVRCMPCCLVAATHMWASLRGALLHRHWLHDQVLVPVRVFAVAIPLLAVIGLLFDAYNNYGFGVQDPDRAWFWLNLLSVLCTIVRGACCVGLCLLLCTRLADPCV